DSVTLTFRYRPDCCQIVKTGLKEVSDYDWSYKLATLFNKSFNELAWPSIKEGSQVLWQKESQYGSITDWRKARRPRDNVAAYNTDVTPSYILPDYQDHKEPQVYENTLRGEFNFYTYLNNKLDITLELFDLNRADNEDNIIAWIENIEGERIWLKTIPDDGLVDSNDPPTGPHYLTFREDDEIKPGVYRVFVQTTYDVFTTKIITPHRYLTFSGNLYLADSGEYQDGLPGLPRRPSLLITNSQVIKLSTSHFAGLQTVVANGQNYELGELQKKYTISTTDELMELVIPQNDIMYETIGLTAFSVDTFFVPATGRTEIVSTDDDLDYFIASYDIPQRDNDGFFTSSVTFDLDQADIRKGKITFIISAPGATKSSPFTISDMKLRYNSQSDLSWSEAIKYLKYWRHSK
ncbi:MAG: hypothetical protein NUV82_02760, partial [Candidatus Komeilibacteria bacterium]|nr:hypothetical protein [Candidatus Komeilibacteria bacterium]